MSVETSPNESGESEIKGEERQTAESERKGTEAPAITAASVEERAHAEAQSGETEGGEIEDENAEIDEETVKSFSLEQKAGIIEALLIANGEPLSVQRIHEASKIGIEEIESALTAIGERHRCESAGYDLVCVAGQYQFRTKAKHAQFIRALKAKAPRRLSNAALETISIVAYRQPIVKSDIERIRGVDATPTLKTLLEKNLIKIVGHQPSVGQPALYGTTDEFLKLFGLTSLSELPTLRDLQELEKDPGEVDAEDSQPTSQGGEQQAAQ